MNPITLNKEGEQLMSRDDIPDASTLTTFNAGRHAVCDGTMRVLGISRTHNALICPECYLRISFPNTVKTYRDLRSHLLDLQK